MSTKRNNRSMWDELREGATDAALKKARPDTSNVSDDVTADARGLLHDAVNDYDMATAGATGARRYTSGIVRGS